MYPHVGSFQKTNTNELIYKAEIDSQTQKTNLGEVTKGKE